MWLSGLGCYVCDQKVVDSNFVVSRRFVDGPLSKAITTQVLPAFSKT